MPGSSPSLRSRRASLSDLVSLVNEAAILATRNDATHVGMDGFNLAIERIVTGLEHKVSIIPRAIGALGYTIQRPPGDCFPMSSGELKDTMAVFLGGRAAGIHRLLRGLHRSPTIWRPHLYRP